MESVPDAINVCTRMIVSSKLISLQIFVNIAMAQSIAQYAQVEISLQEL